MSALQVSRTRDTVGVVAEEAETVEEGDSLGASGYGLVALRTDIARHATVGKTVCDVAAQLAQTPDQIVALGTGRADVVLSADETVSELHGVAEEAGAADHGGSRDTLDACVHSGTGLAEAVGARSALAYQVGLGAWVDAGLADLVAGAN